MSIYLDQAATSYPKAPGVAQAVYESLSSESANANRSSYASAVRSSRLLYRVRKQLSTYFGFPHPERILFSSGATESLNLVIRGMVPQGGSVLVSPMEHNAVSRVLTDLHEQSHCTITSMEADSFGFPDLSAFARQLDLLSPDLTVFTGESNVTGTIFPISQMIELLEARGLSYCIDGAQLTGDMPVGLQAMHHGAFCCSAHKGLLAPTGVGILLLGSGLDPKPLIHGGTGSQSDSDRQPAILPDRYESGTPNIHGITGLQAALTYLLAHGRRLYAQKREISEHLYAQLQQFPDIRIHSPEHGRGSVISWTHARLSVSDIAAVFDREQVAQRMGMHCAPWAHRHIGTYDGGGTIRFSTGSETTREEIDHLIDLMRRHGL